MNTTSKRFNTNLLGAMTLAAVMGLAANAVSAAEIIVLPGDPTWKTGTENANGGSSTITSTMPYNGNGSIEMTGDRTRFYTGSIYTPTSNFGLLDQVNSLTYSWAIAAGSVAMLNPDYTPALRLYISDAGVRSELIWEGVYNNTYGNTQKGQFYTSTANDVFYRFAGGVTTSGGSQVNMTVRDWAASTYYGPGAFVTGFGVGVGSSAGTGYRAFADNVTLDVSGVATTYNFETAAAAVPEPGMLALFGLGALGLGLARRKKAA